MHRPISGFLRDHLQRRYDGPIPPGERRRIEAIASAERFWEESLAPIERAFQRVCRSYGELMRETARLEAMRQILVEDADPARKAEYQRCVGRVIARARALEGANAALLSTAREEIARA